MSRNRREKVYYFIAFPKGYNIDYIDYDEDVSLYDLSYKTLETVGINVTVSREYNFLLHKAVALPLKSPKMLKFRSKVISKKYTLYYDDKCMFIKTLDGCDIDDIIEIYVDILEKEKSIRYDV